MPSNLQERVYLDATNFVWARGTTKNEIRIDAVKKLIEYGVIKPEDVVQASSKVPLFQDYAEEWFKTYREPKLRFKTKDGYRTCLDKHLYPYFGSFTLDAIKTADIQKFYNTKREFAQSTNHQMHVLLNGILSSAVEDGYMALNPAKSSRISYSKTKTIREPLEKEEILDIARHLCELSRSDRMLISLFLFTDRKSVV